MVVFPSIFRNTQVEWNDGNGSTSIACLKKFLPFPVPFSGLDIIFRIVSQPDAFHLIAFWGDMELECAMVVSASVAKPLSGNKAILVDPTNEMVAAFLRVIGGGHPREKLPNVRLTRVDGREIVTLHLPALIPESGNRAGCAHHIMTKQANDASIKKIRCQRSKE